jgi:hypothetical protein
MRTRLPPYSWTKESRGLGNENLPLPGGSCGNISPRMKPNAHVARLVLGLLAPVFLGICALAGQPRIDVILWFDTEDYMLSASDDSAKRLAEMLTERHVRATFKVVGEKARRLERRGRYDVINALRKHTIAYHANFHSVHPTPTECLADCGWLDGIAEFARREGGGAADVRRIFSVKTLGCYGQPGSSWAPQAVAALKQIGVAPHGVPCYVDEGDHVGLNAQPFWYDNVLTVYDMAENCTRMDLHDPAAVEPAERKFAAIAERLRKTNGGGLISIYYHPCEFIHRQFWDAVNFSRGANPPREQWKAPQERSQEEIEGSFARFGQYIDFIRSRPNVRFVTASDLPEIYPDAVRSLGATPQDLADIASSLVANGATGADFRTLGDRSYSVADQFELLAIADKDLIAGREPGFPLAAKGLFGPDSPPPAGGQLTHIEWPAFRDTLRDVVDFIQTQHRVPARVFIGADAISPARFLVAMAEVYESDLHDGRLPLDEGVKLGSDPELLPARHIAKDTPGLFGGWIIHKEGFRAPKLLELARLQTWTLKPAIRTSR